MPTPITNTTVSFTYNIADKMYSDSIAAGRTASASYTGPDRVWVFVDEETGKFSRISPILTSKEDGADVPTPPGHVKVELVAEDNPAIIASFFEELVTYSDTSETTEDLPDPYSSVTFNTFQTLSQTHDIDNFSYNTATSTWDMGPLVPSPVTWDDVLNHRNGALTGSDGRISPDMPSTVKQPWIDFRQALRDLPAVYGYGTADEVEAWKVEFPAHPED